MKSLLVCAGLLAAFAACTIQTVDGAKVGGASCSSNDQCESGACEGGSCTNPASGSSGGGAAIISECIADELDSKTTATSLFNVNAGEAKSVSVSFSGGQLKTFESMACKPHPLSVAPRYPGCNQGFDCGPCFCQLAVPGFGTNLWSVTCNDLETNGTACAKYKYIKYDIGPWAAPTSGSSSGSSGSSGSTSCGVCTICYDDCKTSCDGYPGSCSVRCQAGCDKCCSRN